MRQQADNIGWFAAAADDTLRIRDAFERHAREVAERSRPDYAVACSAASAAADRLDQTSRAYFDAPGHYSVPLSHYGRLAHLENPPEYQNEIESRLRDVRAGIAGVRDQIRDLLSEPAVRTLPSERIAAERDTWTIERDTARTAADRRSAQLNAQAYTDGISHEPWEPAPEHSPGIGR